MGAAWYRGGHTGWGTLKDWIDVVSLARQKNLKVLDVINASTDDWDDGRTRPAENAGPDFTKHCGWQGGSRKLSQINLGKFASRLRAELDAVNGAGLTIDAFEVGNEYDWYCFNGDVPNGHEATQEEFMTAVRGYAHFLKAAAEVIHQYFPDARIITFGIAHGSDQWDKPPHHLSNPARMVAQLRNVDGYNYLDNSGYHVDGFGEHFYPSADMVGQWMQNTLQQDTAVLGQDKPLWIREWGLDSRRYPNKAGQSRAQAMAEFYASLEKFKASRFTFGPVFYYSYAGDGPAGGSALTDKTGSLLPDATEVVRHR